MLINLLEWITLERINKPAVRGLQLALLTVLFLLDVSSLVHNFISLKMLGLSRLFVLMAYSIAFLSELILSFGLFALQNVSKCFNHILRFLLLADLFVLRD